MSLGNRLGAAIFGVVLLLGVGVFLALGFVLLLALVAAGLVLGAALAVKRRLAGGTPPRAGELDPALEVAPPRDVRALTERDGSDNPQGRNRASESR